MLITRISDLSDPALDDYSRLTDVALRRVSEPAGGLYIAEST
ncbi:MAG TPA: rRNA methyltransferase, partial [Diaminobutyricibacter sp.]